MTNGGRLSAFMAAVSGSFSFGIMYGMSAGAFCFGVMWIDVLALDEVCDALRKR